MAADFCCALHLQYAMDFGKGSETCTECMIHVSLCHQEISLRFECMDGGLEYFRTALASNLSLAKIAFQNLIPTELIITDLLRRRGGL